MSCIVPGCSSNYRGEEHFTKVFSFPKDYEVREKWFRAIPRPREDYQDNKNIKVSIIIFFSHNYLQLPLVIKSFLRFVYTTSKRNSLKGRSNILMDRRWL